VLLQVHHWSTITVDMAQQTLALKAQALRNHKACDSMTVCGYACACRLLATGHASAASRTAAEWLAEFKAAASSGDKLAALNLPGPSSSIVQCYVRRVTGLLGMAPSFELRLESTDELLALARRRKKSATSSYLISTGGSAAAVTRDDDELTGKVSKCVLRACRMQ
jgi:hypothetical protein